MSAVEIVAPPPLTPDNEDDEGIGQKLAGAVSDAAAVAGRNLLTLLRLPQLLVFSTVQPVVFVLLFRYAFGGAIRTSPGVAYVDFLMPGIFVQTVVFGAIGTGIGLASDLQQGFIERFRSLPMARSAVLVGRVASDMVRNVFVIALMAVVGFLVGFRVHTNAIAFLASMGLLLAFGCAMSALFAWLGLLMRDPETTQAAAFPLMAPLVFASSAFVPVRFMPGWLQAFSSREPVSVVVDATRALSLGGSTAGHLVGAVVWTVLVLVVFGVLAVRQYRRTT
ncbi:MAG: ABC transporter permease [Acidimicrobiales bacterium]